VAVPGYRVGRRRQRCRLRGDLCRGLWLVVGERSVGDYAIVDEFNIVFIAINTLVGFKTALFSASYIGHEIETGKPVAELRAIVSRHVPGDDGAR